MCVCVVFVCVRVCVRACVRALWCIDVCWNATLSSFHLGFQTEFPHSFTSLWFLFFFITLSGCKAQHNAAHTYIYIYICTHIKCMHQTWQQSPFTFQGMQNQTKLWGWQCNTLTHITTNTSLILIAEASRTGAEVSHFWDCNAHQQNRWPQWQRQSNCGTYPQLHNGINGLIVKQQVAQ